jgi:ribonuclease D
MSFEIVTDANLLAGIVESCRSKPAVAIDTEFARFNTYYPVVGLVQIYDGDRCYLIDPLEINDLSPLAELLADENVVKVLHACSEDVEVFCDALDVVPTPIYDTQIAAAMLGAGFSISYQNLVNHYLEIQIPKDETRSDWLQRPLTHAQLDYAALDVTHLLEVYQLQVEKLAELGRDDWVAEECASLAQDIPTQIDPNDYYLKVKNLWRLKPLQLHTLKLLCAWRERTARDKNLPRNRVIDEKALFQIAAMDLEDKKAFREKAGVTSKQLRFHGDELVEHLKTWRSVPADELPSPVKKVNSPVSNTKLRALKKLVEDCASELDVAPEMLAKRRHLEQLIRSEADTGKYELPKALSGWRETVIGDVLLREVNGLKKVSAQ